MKKVLKFSGVIALVLAIVAFILLMATTGVYYQYKGSDTRVLYAGTTVLFGNDKETWLGTAHTSLAPTALIGWILIVVAMIIVALGVILPLLKVKALDKFAGLLNLVAVVAFIVAGVLLFFTVPAFISANGGDNTDYFHLGAGWVIGAILAIAAGAFAILPAAAAFIGSKKK